MTFRRHMQADRFHPLQGRQLVHLPSQYRPTVLKFQVHQADPYRDIHLEVHLVVVRVDLRHHQHHQEAHRLDHHMEAHHLDLLQLLAVLEVALEVGEVDHPLHLALRLHLARRQCQHQAYHLHAKSLLP